MFWYFLVLQVLPLHMGEELPIITLNKEQTFYVRQSWDGKCFKVLSPDTFSKLKEANKERCVTTNSSKTIIPSDILTPVKRETQSVVQSATKPKNTDMQVESKHSVSKSSLAKERHSQRVANNDTKTPTARKKLELNSMYMAIFCPFSSSVCVLCFSLLASSNNCNIQHQYLWFPCSVFGISPSLVGRHITCLSRLLFQALYCLYPTAAANALFVSDKSK